MAGRPLVLWLRPLLTADVDAGGSGGGGGAAAATVYKRSRISQMVALSEQSVSDGRSGPAQIYCDSPNI